MIVSPPIPISPYTLALGIGSLQLSGLQFEGSLHYAFAIKVEKPTIAATLEGTLDITASTKLQNNFEQENDNIFEKLGSRCLMLTQVRM
jgi:hypothetical protein